MRPPREEGGFFGREAERAALLDLLARTRRATLAGPAGSGKTRLASRLARDHARSWPDGVWWCDARGATTEEDVWLALGLALGVPTHDDAPARLERALAARGRCLVVLDGLVGAAPIGAWLRRGDARLLVTRRAPEAEESTVSLAPLGPVDAAALFADRAGRRPSGDVSGWPLGIELLARAPWPIPERPPSDLDDVAGALVGAMPAWASEGLGQLGVLERGFTRDAAAAVLDLAAQAGAPDAPEVLRVLIAAGWLREVGEGLRYERVLAPCRSADEAGARRRAASWFGRFGDDDAIGALDGPDGKARLAERRLDLPNLRAHGGPRAVDAVLERLGHGGGYRPPTSPAPGDLRGRVYTSLAEAARLLRRGDRVAATEAAESAYAGASATGDVAGQTRAASVLARTHRLRGRAEAAGRYVATALAGARRLGDASHEAEARGQGALLAWALGRADEARRGLQLASRLAEEAGDTRAVARWDGHLGGIERALDHLPEARALLDRALAATPRDGSRAWLSLRLERAAASEASDVDLAALADELPSDDRAARARVELCRATLARAQGRRSAAIERLTRAVADLGRDEDRPDLASALRSLASLHLDAGALQEAGDALARAEAALTALDDGAALASLLRTRALLALRAGDEAKARSESSRADALARQASLGERAGAPLQRALPQVGAKVGAWRIGRLLAKGGMAAVFVATHDDGRRGALKLPLRADSSWGRRMLREAALQASVAHPNVLSVAEVFTWQGHPALVVELVDGPDLYELLSLRTPTLAQAHALGVGVVLGVRAAHRRGLVHRDLKPANVLVDGSTGALVPKVGDFGLVAAVEAKGSLTGSGVGFGTPAYMAPEQFRDAADVDARADVFAVGCILYELVAGERLVTGLTPLDAFGRAVGAVPRVRALAGRVPEPLIAAIARSVAPERDDRWPDCDALLAAWLDGAQAPAAGRVEADDVGELRIRPEELERFRGPQLAPAHPELGQLAAATPSPEVAAHLEGCAFCRVERRRLRAALGR